MLYNMDKDRPKQEVDCLSCRCYNAGQKKCNGLGIVCNEIDTLTNTIFDAKTGLPVTARKEIKNGNNE